MNICRLCGSDNLLPVFAIKDCLIDGVYLETVNECEVPKQDFSLLKCQSCGLVQLKEIVDQEKIYSNYKFSSTNTKYILGRMVYLSDTLIDIFKIKNKKILEIGASDGCFLNFFKTENTITGIEPSKMLVDVAKEKYDISLENGYFTHDSYKGRKFDLILCRHVLEHIEKIEDFIQAMDTLVDEKGKIYLEVPDIDMILDNLNYSNFFHEHINYFSRDVLIDYFKKLGYKTLFLTDNQVHNGSFGVLMEKKGKDHQFNDLQNKIATDISKFDAIFSSKNYTNIVGYGAANKTFKLISLFDLEEKLSCVYDINKSLDNIYISAKKPIKIKKSQDIVNDKPDCIIIFATSYTDEILSYLKNDIGYSGDIITLFPEIKKYTI